MNMIYWMVPLALILSGFFLAAFFWCVQSGQYDDIESQSFKITLDERKDNNGN